MQIDQALTEAMVATGVTKAELARRMGVSRQFIGQLASGQRGVTEDMLQQIAAALGCSVTVQVSFMAKT